MFDCTKKLLLFGQGINEEIYCTSLSYQVSQQVILHSNWKGRAWCTLLFWSEIVDSIVRLGRSLITPVGAALNLGATSDGVDKAFWYTCGVAGAVIITPLVFAIQLIIQVGHMLRVCLATVCGLFVPDGSAFALLSGHSNDWYNYKALLDKFLFESNNLPENFPIPIAKGEGSDFILKNLIHTIITSEVTHSKNAAAFLARFTLDSNTEITRLVKKWKKYLQPYFNNKGGPNHNELKKMFINSIVHNCIPRDYPFWESPSHEKATQAFKEFTVLFLQNLPTAHFIGELQKSNFQNPFSSIKALAKKIVPHLEIFVPEFPFEKTYEDRPLLEIIIAQMNENISKLISPEENTLLASSLSTTKDSKSESIGTVKDEYAQTLLQLREQIAHNQILIDNIKVGRHETSSAESESSSAEDKEDSLISEAISIERDYKY